MKFISHEPCPECRKVGNDRSGDNLGVWEDHKYCFSCGYYEGSSNAAQFKRIIDNNKTEREPDDLFCSLPADCVSVLPDKATKWLDKYGLTEEEKAKFVWSGYYERLIYPVYDTHQNLTMYTGRKFASDDKKYLKYHIEGKLEKIYHILGELSTEIVVVEDVVSALKISRQFQVMPIWGSNISPERIKTLSGMFYRLSIWLDKDKAQYSLKTRLNASPYFDHVRSIITEKDPKEYNDEQIKEILE